MTIPAFQLHMPDTIDEAIVLARRFNGQSAFVAGGTDLLCNYSYELDTAANLISLSRITCIKEITPQSIGAGVTIAELVRQSAMLPPVIGQTARLIAGPALREAATVGGNLVLSGRCVHFNRSKLYRCSHGPCMKAEGKACVAVPQDEQCYAPFSGDLGPVFLALGAEFVISGPDGTRVVPSHSFYLTDGIQSNVLGPLEILQQVVLPDDACKLDCRYLKLRPRSAIDFPEAGVAVAVKRNGSTPAELRVALGALGPAPIVLVKQSDELAGHSPDKLAQKLWEEMAPSVLAVRNTSFAPGYRREMAQLFIRRLVKELLS